jgi:hypothetical protein
LLHDDDDDDDAFTMTDDWDGDGPEILVGFTKVTQLIAQKALLMLDKFLPGVGK